MNEIHLPEGLEAFDLHLKLVLDGIALPRLRRPAWEGGPITFDSCETEMFQKGEKQQKQIWLPWHWPHPPPSICFPQPAHSPETRIG